MRVRADQRSRDVHPAPAAERAARDALRELAQAELKAAHALATIERSRSHVRLGFASVHSWAASVGYGPRQTQRLLALGRTLACAPELEASVRAGKAPSESAIAIGKVLLEPSLTLSPREQRAWIQKARTVPPQELRDLAERAVEQARQGQPTLPLRLLVTRDARDGFRRARLLLSKGEALRITEGTTLEKLAKAWLMLHDPLLKPLPARRCGPTRGRPSRYLPRQVAAIVERRSGGRCEICRTRRATQKIHILTPHTRGGSRESDNIADACKDCHVLVDAGVFGFSHFDEQGHPQWNFFPRALYGLFFGEPRSKSPVRVRETPPPFVALAFA